MFLVNAYIEIYKSDIPFISETHLDSGTASDDNNSEILDTTQFVQTTLLRIKEVVFGFITKAFYL